MKVDSYVKNVLVPGNAAVSRLRMNGLPVSLERLHASVKRWNAEADELEKLIKDFGIKHGMVLTFSKARSLPKKQLLDVLYGKGLGLPIEMRTPTGEPSTDGEALMEYASLMNPRPTDDPVVRAILKLRSISKAISTNAGGFEKTRRSDGCCHPQFSWALRTARLSAENPNTQNIPEKADREVADEVKSWLVPRIKPAPTPEEWDPRIHGSCMRWDIAGAEAAIRAACLTALFCSEPDPIAWEFIRLGKDIHSKTASLIFGKPDGFYKKGDLEREAVGKNTTFAKLYGATWKTVQATIWDKARHWLEDEEAKGVSDRWEQGYPMVMELYELDKDHLGRLGYCEDGYGRRRWIPIPAGATYRGLIDGKAKWDIKAKDQNEYQSINGKLNHAFHVAANTPTQGMSATDALFMLALTTLGEYIDLELPPMWKDLGLDFPEASTWRLNGGPGPDGPIKTWYSNTVHDSGWLDCAPGRHIESAAKVIWRRCHALPMDWRIKTDTPYRVELKVGPDHSHLKPYNLMAKKFGFEELPER